MLQLDVQRTYIGGFCVYNAEEHRRAIAMGATSEAVESAAMSPGVQTVRFFGANIEVSIRASNFYDCVCIACCNLGCVPTAREVTSFHKVSVNKALCLHCGG